MYSVLWRHINTVLRTLATHYAHTREAKPRKFSFYLLFVSLPFNLSSMFCFSPFSCKRNVAMLGFFLLLFFFFLDSF